MDRLPNNLLIADVHARGEAVSAAAYGAKSGLIIDGGRLHAPLLFGFTKGTLVPRGKAASSSTTPALFGIGGRARRASLLAIPRTRTGALILRKAR